VSTRNLLWQAMPAAETGSAQAGVTTTSTCRLIAGLVAVRQKVGYT